MAKKQIKTYRKPSKTRQGKLAKELRTLIAAYDRRDSQRAFDRIAKFCKLDNPFERGYVVDVLIALHAETPRTVVKIARQLARERDLRTGRIGANVLFALFKGDYARCKRAIMARLKHDPEYVQAMVCGLCYACPDEAADDLPKLFGHRSHAVRLGALHGLEAIGVKHPRIAFEYLDEYKATDDEVEKFWVEHVLALNLIPKRTSFSMQKLKSWLKEGADVTREIVEEAVSQARKHYAVGKEKMPGLYEKLKETAAKWADDSSVYVSEVGRKLKKAFKK
jgi:hypothetical protein